ncbi:hypothetical protein ACJMK2_043748 [Sinanodonta woodiana]|uniref:Uncharacterized protein n=1 Tax=Sinanodonta woodiana TaxID=1069815 RepID=A0ABD3W117_SINWO
MNGFGQASDNNNQQLGWQESYKTAQLMKLPDLGLVCGASIQKLVTNHARAIGCPDEYIILPLLSVTSGLMGSKSKIKVNQVWQEPPVLWTMVGAGPGTRKTAALKQIMIPLLEIQKEQEKLCHLPSMDPSAARPHKLLSGPLGLADLIQVLKKNGGQIISVCEDLEAYHKLLGLGASSTKTQMLSLYDGLPFLGVDDSEIPHIESTCFTHTGMVTPEYIVKLHLHNPSWLCSRYLVACASSPNFSTIWKSIPMSPDTPSMKSVLQILYNFHQQPTEYTFTEDAWKELTRCHDEEWTSIMSQLENDEKRRSIIEKSLGQIVRVSGVLKALLNACEYTKQLSEQKGSTFQWDFLIDRDMVRRSIEFSKYFVEQKLALMLLTGFSFGPTYISQGPQLIAQRQQQTQQPKQQTVEPQFPQQSPQVAQRASVPESNTTPSAEDWSNFVYDNSDADIDEQQYADFMHMDRQLFAQTYAKRIKRLVESFDDGYGVSATTASQKSITPPVRIPGSNNRHPVWASALFFQKVAELGIGTAEQLKHPTNRKFFWRFKRKRPNELTEKNLQLLHYLKVDMSIYNKIGPRFPIPLPPVSPSTPSTSNADYSGNEDSLDNNASPGPDNQAIKSEPIDEDD